MEQLNKVSKSKPIVDAPGEGQPRLIRHTVDDEEWRRIVLAKYGRSMRACYDEDDVASDVAGDDAGDVAGDDAGDVADDDAGDDAGGDEDVNEVAMLSRILEIDDEEDNGDDFLSPLVDDVAPVASAGSEDDVVILERTYNDDDLSNSPFAMEDQ